jgi:hypothetical protein
VIHSEDTAAYLSWDQQRTQKGKESHQGPGIELSGWKKRRWIARQTKTRRRAGRTKKRTREGRDIARKDIVMRGMKVGGPIVPVLLW